MIEDAPPGAVSSSPSRKTGVLARLELLIAISLTATVLSFLATRATHAGALWRDEAATLQLAQMPTISEIAANFQHEAFPVPFPLLIRCYVALFGASDASLRWFGFAVGVALLAAAWFNSRTVDDRGPLLFLALFGLNATFLLWGTSLRGYGLGYVFLLLTIGLSAQAVRAPTSRNAIFATVASIGAVQFMINAVPLIAAIALSAILAFAIEKQFRRAVIVCVCGAVCAISFLPYAHSYLGADWSIVLKYPVDFFSLWDKFQLSLQEHSMLAAILWYAAVPLIIILALFRLWIFRRQDSSTEARLLLFLTATCVLSILTYYAFLKILSYATRPWYYLPLLCALAGAIDLAGRILSSDQLFRIARILFAIVALFFLPFKLWAIAQERLTDIDVLAHKLEQEAAPNDLIVVNPWHFAPSFFRYYHGSTPWITVPIMTEHRVHRYDLMKSKMIEADPLSDVRSAIQQALQSGHRVWIVGGARPLDPNMPRLGPAPNPYFGWAGYMSYWSMEIGSFLNEHTANGQVVIEPMPDVNDGENVPLLMAEGWKD
ncbi:MAG TPA: hypothetical protein VNX27_12325 [Chthoniobacterales bacterium]|nr:hypothetical protein [Chthoniobacterales bacterium]